MSSQMPCLIFLTLTLLPRLPFKSSLLIVWWGQSPGRRGERDFCPREPAGSGWLPRQSPVCASPASFRGNPLVSCLFSCLPSRNQAHLIQGQATFLVAYHGEGDQGVRVGLPHLCPLQTLSPGPKWSAPTAAHPVMPLVRHRPGFCHVTLESYFQTLSPDNIQSLSFTYKERSRRLSSQTTHIITWKHFLQCSIRMITFCVKLLWCIIS